MLGKRRKDAGDEAAETTETGESTATTATPAKEKRRPRTSGATRGRLLAARLLWAVTLVLASFLAAGALLIALEANRDNGLVQLVLDVADGVDLGVFERDNGIFRFESGSDQSVETKNALVNWGLAAIVWMVAGRIAERIVRP